MKNTNIENTDALDARFRELLIKKRGSTSRPDAAKNLSKILGRKVPTTTYQGYETCRNPPRDVLRALHKLYDLKPWELLGWRNEEEVDTVE